jgi:hypothetical protein
MQQIVFVSPGQQLGSRRFHENEEVEVTICEQFRNANSLSSIWT